ncbi:uracil permease [Erysipelotrichaceae bacterium 51-3]|uniref:uracil permease n=1 Tax=Allobaculum sp. JKK-2023 TaxID=3108943 RepID=UPI002B05C0F8|nr:uracil permease [Allobaculum sp. JKK-2023]
MAKKIIQVEEKVPASLMLPLSVQHLFAMFGATVLVPFVLGINPAIVLFMNGVGTLLFIAITKGKAPAYLGSSFAFLGPASLVIARWGYPYALGGFVAVGFMGCILAFIIKKFGTKWIDVVLPPAAMGPVVALIGLELSSSAASTAGIVGDGILMSNVIIFLVTLGTAIIGNLCFRKFFSIISILIAVIVGYITAACLGAVDFAPIGQAALFQMPNFQFPKFSWSAILTMLPVILVIASEHVGHQIVTSQIVGRDLIKDPGLDKTIFADNFSTMISGLVGSVPTTTYGENIGVMALTGVYSVWVIGGAAVLSICCAFIGPLCALIQSIPSAVIGGISFLLYGMIGVSGLRILIDEKVDYGNTVNMILTSVVFVTGLSGVTVQLGDIALSGMVLAALVGILMSLMIYIFNKLHLLNENSSEPQGEMKVLEEVVEAEQKAKASK